MGSGACHWVAIGLLFVQCRLCAKEGELPDQRRPAVKSERVVLQLSWQHRFQFAGYYMAQEKGYYREAGFDVVFREKVNGDDNVSQVVSGQADFAVGSSGLIADYLQGAPVMVLAAVLQHSPVVIVASKRSGVRSLSDLAGKRVLVADDKLKVEAFAMLSAQGISLDQLVFVSHDRVAEALADGRADVCIGYVADEPYTLDQLGVPYVAFSPRKYGGDAFGELLYTSRQKARTQPERVQAFRGASLKGWKYAVNHVDETIDHIIKVYAPAADRDRLEYEARTISGLMAADLVDIGHVSTGRWKRIMQGIAVHAGASPDVILDWKSDDVLFVKYYLYHRIRSVRYLVAVLFVSGCVIVLMGGLSWVLARVVKRRTTLLSEVNQKLAQENDALVRAEFLLGLQRDFAAAMNEAMTLQACLDRAMDFILRMPGVDNCGIFLISEMENVLKLAASRGVSAALAEQHAVYDAARTCRGVEVMAGRNVRVGSDVMPGFAGDPAVAQENVTACVMVPVTFGPQVIASLNVGSCSVTDFSVHAMADIESLAMLMGSAINRLKTNEILRQSEERFRLIVEHAGVGMMVVNESGHVIFNNVLACDAGNGGQDCAERHVLEEGIAKDCGKHYQNQIRHVLEKGETLEFISRITVDSKRRCFEVTMRPLTLPSQESRVVLIMTKDVSEKWETWETLQESEANFRNLAENGMDMFAMINRQGVLVYRNRQFESFMGYTADEFRLKPLTLHDMLHPSHVKLVQARLEAQIEVLYAPPRYETVFVNKEGRSIPVELVASHVVWHNEPCVFISARDISERLKAEKDLQEREALFKSVAEGAFDAISLSDLEGRYLYVNTRMTQMLGYSAQELLGTTFERLVHPSERERIMRTFENRKNYGLGPRWKETIFERKDGSPFPIEVVVNEIEWKGRRAFVSVMKDISERKRLELEILRIGEWEKLRIGQDLHDSIGQQLVGMTYLAEALGYGLKASGSAHAAEAVQVTDICRALHQQLRDIVRGLLPLAEDERLAEGLNRLSENVRAQTGVSCVLKDSVGELVLAVKDESHLYEIAQEAVSNAVRHGKARHLMIALEPEGDHTVMRIDDDGCGFDVDGVRSTGSGLKIMRYRMDILKGALSIRRRDAGGMSVCCTFSQSCPNVAMSKTGEKNELTRS